MILQSCVTKLERRSRIVRVVRLPDGSEHATTEDRGWFLVLEGTGVGLWCGPEKPENLSEGDLVTVTIARRE